MSHSSEYSIYSLGREVEVLESLDFGGHKILTGKTFISNDFSEQGKEKIRHVRFEHSTFANVNFKEAQLKKCSFLDCVFIGCYFRRAELDQCCFVGCRFFDCRFPNIKLRQCDFRYASFRGCQINYSEMKHNFPYEPNLRENLARNLSAESAHLGFAQQARLYRTVEIRSREESLKAAVCGKEQWYREHYSGSARLHALFQWLVSRTNCLLWGYGERFRTLVRNFFILVPFLFSLLFYAIKDELKHSNGEEIGWLDVILFSVSNLIPGSTSTVIASGFVAQVFVQIESLLGIIATALLAAYIFRWSLHR